MKCGRMRTGSDASMVFEDNLINRLKGHEPQAMAELYDRCAPLVYSMVRRIVGDSEAEDIVQEVFLRVWSRSHLIDPSKGSLTNWVVRVARNVAIDSLRGKRSTDVVSMRAPGDLPDLHGCGTERDHLNRIFIQRALQDLDVNRSLVLELAYFEGLSHSEVSQRMHRPLGTIKTWARTALSSIRVWNQPHAG